jgi:5-carboxymethyl-2-hydroxymuconate isomerase
MPHLVLQHSANVRTPMQPVCDALARTIRDFLDVNGKAPFPLAGTRVLAYAAQHAAVADGAADNAFVYANLRIAPGRSRAAVQGLGEALATELKALFANELANRPLGLTLQIDEGEEAFGAKLGNLHARF